MRYEGGKEVTFVWCSSTASKCIQVSLGRNAGIIRPGITRANALLHSPNSELCRLRRNIFPRKLFRQTPDVEIGFTSLESFCSQGDAWKHFLAIRVKWHLSRDILRGITLAFLAKNYLHKVVIFITMTSLNEGLLRREIIFNRSLVPLEKIDFNLISNLMEYDPGDIFRIDFETNGILFDSTSKGKWSPLLHSIQLGRIYN